MFSLRCSLGASSSLLRVARPARLARLVSTDKDLPNPDGYMEVSPGNSYIARPTPPTEGMTEKEIKEARYPHTRPAPRIAPVVPIGSMPIPGHGPWSMVQTGALGRIPPLDKNLPEGKPGVLGEGLFYGTEADVWKWELTNTGFGVASAALIIGIFCATGYVAVVMHGGSVSSLWGPPPKPAGDYSLEEDQAREAMFRRRRAVIAAKEKAAELKAQAAEGAYALTNRLDSAKDEIAGKVEDVASKVAGNASAQLQYMGEKYQDLKAKA